MVTCSASSVATVGWALALLTWGGSITHTGAQVERGKCGTEGLAGISLRLELVTLKTVFQVSCMQFDLKTACAELSQFDTTGKMHSAQRCEHLPLDVHCFALRRTSKESLIVFSNLSHRQ